MQRSLPTKMDHACRDHRPDFSATLTTVAFDHRRSRWLGVSDLITDAFLSGLRDLGHVEGTNIRTIKRSKPADLPMEFERRVARFRFSGSSRESFAHSGGAMDDPGWWKRKTLEQLGSHRDSHFFHIRATAPGTSPPSQKRSRRGMRPLTESHEIGTIAKPQ